MQHSTIAILVGITFAILIVFGVAGIRRNRASKDDLGEIPSAEELKKGMSAFEVAQAGGFTGTQEEWVRSIAPSRKYSRDEVAYIFGKDPKEKTAEKLLEIFKGPSDPLIKSLAFRHWKGSELGPFLPSALVENLPGFIRLEDEFINNEYAIGFIVLGTQEAESEDVFGLSLSSSFSLNSWDYGPFRKHYKIVYFTGAKSLSDSKLIGSIVYAVKADIIIDADSKYNNRGNYPGVDGCSELSWCRDEIHDIALAFNENIHGDHVAALVRHQEELAAYALLQSRHLEMVGRRARRIKVNRSKAIMNNSRGFPIARHLL